MPYLTVGELAKLIATRTGCAVHPRDLTQMLYLGRMNVNAPIIGGRRMIDPNDVPSVILALKRAGLMPADVHAFA